MKFVVSNVYTTGVVKLDHGIRKALSGPAVPPFEAVVTVNVTELDGVPPTVTMTGPVDAVDGTVAVILVALHEVTVAWTPLKVTKLVFCVAPNPVPAITQLIPVRPLFGVRLVMFGVLPAE